VTDIRFVKQNQIDWQKWDACIALAHNSLPYAYSWYLKAVAEHTDGLVLNDYEAVMPLVWLTKYGIKCLYQPYYCQQLGVFSSKELAPKTLTAFLQATLKNAPYVNINLNPSLSPIADDFDLLLKRNLLLALNEPIEELRKKYAENTKRNIAKATKANMHFFESMDLEQFYNFYLPTIDTTKVPFTPKDKERLRALVTALFANNMAKLYVVADPQGIWHSTMVMIQTPNRLINIINASSATGKKNGASHFLFHQVIAAFSDKNILFDFEGSSIPGIARFYEGFGAYRNDFYQLKTTVIKRLAQRFL
jgi:hypothetical protein